MGNRTRTRRTLLFRHDDNAIPSRFGSSVRKKSFLLCGKGNYLIRLIWQVDKNKKGM